MPDNKRKKLYFCTNTKMFKSLAETLDYVDKLENLTSDIAMEEMELAVMPSYTALYPVCRSRTSSRILIGAQNVCPDDRKELTGEISAPMLAELGVGLVMAGHSERRRLLKETDEQINAKLLSAVDCGLIGMLSISERLEEKEAGVSSEVLRMQLKTGLRGIKAEQVKLLRILYEPAWAVGNAGMSASAEYAQEQHHTIRMCLKELYGEKQGAEIPIIYGGSVSIKNANELILQQDIDGLGIGRNAWDADNFNRIIRQVRQLVYQQDN
jgi:triosephosphate isomerase